MNWIEYTPSKWKHFDMTLLKVDESYVQIIKEIPHKLSIYYLYEDCFKCLYQKIYLEKEVFKLDGSRTVFLKIFEKDHGKYIGNETDSICSLYSNLGEFGVYNLTISSAKECLIVADKEPVNIYTPILTIFLIGMCITLCYKLLTFVWERYKKRNQSENNSAEKVDIQKKKRLKSLDIFRGLVITLMIFVNSGGGHYFWIEHAPWNGLHIADVIFPSFLWIMGVAIPFSINIQLSRGVSKKKLLKDITVRSIKLFLIGISLNSIFGPSLENLRIMGVLQRFGIAYFVCTSFYVIFAKTFINFPETNFRIYVYDLILMREQLLFCLILIIIHLSIVFGLKIPHCPQGYIGPGGIHDYKQFPNCTGGVTGYIDELVLGKNHIYQHSTAKLLYDAKNFDPEGLFGSLLTVVQVFLGIQCGVILQVYTSWKARCIRLFIWILLLGIIGGSLCLFSKEYGLIPVNKNLWSLSFVLVTSAIAYFILLTFHIFVDSKEWWSGYPFLQAGMNPIILYVGHSVLHKMLPWHWRIGLMNTHFMLLLEALWNTILWVLISIRLYNRNVFYNI